VSGQGAGLHGFAEALYAWTSMVHTNGRAFAGSGGASSTATLGPLVEGFAH
jgi:K+-transporting ATPase A subunit